MQSIQEILFGFKLFALVYLFDYYFSKMIFEKNYPFSFKRLISL